MERFQGLFWFLAVALVLYLLHRLKQQDRLRIYELIHRERIEAIRKGLPYPELPPYLIEQEQQEEAHVRQPFQTSQLIGFALILMLGGAASMWALRYSGDAAHQRVWTFGAIPAAIGLGVLLYALLNRPARPE